LLDEEDICSEPRVLRPQLRELVLDVTESVPQPLGLGRAGRPTLPRLPDDEGDQAERDCNAEQAA
jgi:hypothetical protein